MQHSLKNINGLTLDDLKRKIDSGARFVVFKYSIGLGLVSLTRFSPAFLIEEESDISNFRKKYNRLNVFLAPWFFPKGPYFAYSAYRMNKRGGLDVTNDIMININEENLALNSVEIKKVDLIFAPVNKSNKKTFIKALKTLDNDVVPVERAYLGLFLNVEEYQEPYLVLGVQLKKDISLDIDYLNEKLRKHFYKHTVIHIFNLAENPDLGEKIKKQGELIYSV